MERLDRGGAASLSLLERGAPAEAAAGGTSQQEEGGPPELELHCSARPGECRSKVVLLLLHVFAFACCGVDRCYLGNCCLGMIKGITLSGFGIWAMADLFVVVQNALEKRESINTFGITASFTPESLEGGRSLALLAVAFSVAHVYFLSFLPRMLASVPARLLGGRDGRDGGGG